MTTMSTSVNIGKKPAPVTLSDDAAAKVAELGGSILVEPFDSPVGRMAVAGDPQGAMFSVIQPAPPESA